MTAVDWDEVRRRLAAAAEAQDALLSPPAALRKATLRQRAARLARPVAPDSAAGTVELLVFQLAWEDYAVETRFVREFYPLKDLTPIP